MKKAKEDTWRERIFEELVSCYPDDMENFSTMTHSQAYRVLICFWKKIPKINLNQNKMKKTNQYAISYSLGVNVYAMKPEGVEDRISLDNTRARFTAEAEHYLSFLRERYEEEINQQTK